MAQINKPSEYFNTVLYQSNNGTPLSVTGVGFQPDFLWVKDRTAGGDHVLVDAVRGSTKWLGSNSTSAEVTRADQVTSFDSDGFSVGADSGNFINYSTDNNVAWNWLAAGTAPSKTYAVTVVSDGGNKYRFDGYGTSAVTLEISEGGTYRFDQSDSSNSGHPLRFSTTSDGTHGGGSEYTTGVTTVGTPGSAGAYTEITVAASAPTLYYYCSVHSGMGGQANTPTTNSFSSFDGSIQSNISPNTTSGFSIVKYTGTGSNATVGHGLGVVPKMIIVKRTSNADVWRVYHSSMGATKHLVLNTTAGEAVGSNVWNDTEPTSSVFTISTDSAVNSTGWSYIAYCFAEKKGFSKFGSYTGNGNADGTFVYTGFKPAFVLFKPSSAVENWQIQDTKRPGYNPCDNIAPNTSSAEATGNDFVDLVSNGFKLRSATYSASGVTYIYMAFAESPLVGTNNVVTTAK